MLSFSLTDMVQLLRSAWFLPIRCSRSPGAGRSPTAVAELQSHCQEQSLGRVNRRTSSTPLITMSTSTSSCESSRIAKLRIVVSNQSRSIGVVPSGRYHCTRLDGLNRPSCVSRVKNSS